MNVATASIAGTVCAACGFAPATLKVTEAEEIEPPAPEGTLTVAVTVWSVPTGFVASAGARSMLGLTQFLDTGSAVPVEPSDAVASAPIVSDPGSVPT